MPRVVCCLWIALLLVGAGSLSSCSNQVMARHPVSYHFKHGYSPKLQGQVAYAPKTAPKKVQRAVWAGNHLQRKPYKWGGGHRDHQDHGYDCSGAVSYVLREAGLLKGSLTSKGFLKYGDKGPGKWITIYVRNGHVFLTVGGLRLDTGGSGGRTGPRWKPSTRRAKGYAMRHPPGF